MMKTNDKKVRYCMKCHCELTSSNKGILCADCKRNIARTTRNVIGGCLTGIGAILIIPRIFNDEKK